MKFHIKVKLPREAYLFIGTLMMLCCGTLYAWSIFRIALSAEYAQWTAAQLSMAFTIAMICHGVGGFLGGKLSGRTSNRITSVCAAILLLVGYGGLAFLPAAGAAALTQVYICYGVLAGVGNGMGYNSVITGVSQWYPEKNGAATGILLMGFGIGTMLFGQIANMLFAALGLRTAFLILAILQAFIHFIGALLLYLPDGTNPPLPEVPAGAKNVGGEDYAPSQMLRRHTFWLFFLWNAFMCAGGLAVINSAASIASHYGAIAVLGLLVSVCNGFSRIPFGIFLDVLGRTKTMLLANGLMLLSGLTLLVGDRISSAPVVLIGMLILGVCYGNSVTIGTGVIRQFYGEKNFAVNLSLNNCCAIPASIVGPYISGVLQDISGGGFTTTFILVVCLAIADLLLTPFIRKP